VSLATPQKIQRLQESLYAKAKQEPDCRFHFLYDKLHRADVLAHAFALCKSNGGAPGVDGQTFDDVEAYGVEQWLGELREELHEKRYRPQAVRRVMIPKPSGVGERPLGIPTIRDRVAQTAAKLVLEPIFEADFDDAAHGYRPGKSAQEAVQKVERALQTGHTQVLDADLSKYFDTIPHAELIQCVARRVSDKHVLHLIKLWLKAPVEERDERGNRRMTGGKGSKCGTPQGGVISPLLANIYMHRFIKAFRKYDLEGRFGAVLVNYADDFVVLCKRGAAEVLEITRRWMERIGLSVNEEKTCVRDGRAETFNFLGYSFGPLHSRRTGRIYLGARPSKKAVARIQDKIRGKLHNGNMDPWDDVAASLNRTLRGWARYFDYGTITKARKTVDHFVADQVRRFLRRRHKVQSGGHRRFGPAQVFGELGVVRVSTLPRRSFANALV
jgi:RNA-directed DNA polymerase